MKQKLTLKNFILILSYTEINSSILSTIYEGVSTLENVKTL